jgi:hypothetical protein
LPLELLVLTDIGGDHLLDLLAAQQLAKSFAVDAGIVRRDGQIPDARRENGVDQTFGNARQSETARAQVHTINNSPSRADAASG